MDIAVFTFNPFQENTYILYDDTKECIIIDPGCNDDSERKQLTDLIASQGLKPVKLINTHCHIDHVLGNAFVSKTFDLPLASHQGEREVLYMQDQIAKMYGIPYESSPEITKFLAEGDTFTFGKTTMEIIFTPGHSPASISLYAQEDSVLIAGDVLFQGSIGRTDLPGGDYDTLISNIENKLFILPDEVRVYPGHGADTTIGIEKNTNPFFLK